MNAIKVKLTKCLITSTIMFTALLSLLTIQQTESLVVQAASIPVDPSVLIVVDATKPGCILDLSANINTNHPSVIHIPCPAGTIMRTERVSQSQALAKHEDYVLLSSTNASRTISPKMASDIERVKQKRFVSLKSALKANKVLPLTACGTQGSAGVTWGATDGFGGKDHFNIKSSVNWYVLPNPNCNTVVLETASMHVNNAYVSESGYVCWSWPLDKYAGSTYGVPGNPCLSTGANLSHSVNLNNTKGYTYEEWVSYDGSSIFYWCDIPVR